MGRKVAGRLWKTKRILGDGPTSPMRRSLGTGSLRSSPNKVAP